MDEVLALATQWKVYAAEIRGGREPGSIGQAAMLETCADQLEKTVQRITDEVVQ